MRNPIYDRKMYTVHFNDSEHYFAGSGLYLTVVRCTVVEVDEEATKLENRTMFDPCDYWFVLSDEFINVYNMPIDTASDSWPEPVESYNIFECRADGDNYDFNEWTPVVIAIMYLRQFYEARRGFLC